MPDGVGLYSSGRLTPAERAALAATRRPGAGGGRLAATGADAVRALAAAAGHPLPAARVGPGGAATGGSTDLAAWIVFVLGGILIVAAWTWSLRARPLRVRGPRSAA